MIAEDSERAAGVLNQKSLRVTAGLPLGLQAWNSSCSCWFVWRRSLCPSGWNIARRGQNRSLKIRPGKQKVKKRAAGAGPDLDEDRQAVVGVSGSIQVVLVFLRDVRHDQVDQRLHGVMEGGREALVPGQLQGGDGGDGTFTHLHKISTI